VTARTVKPYLKKPQPQDPESLKRYLDVELSAIQVTLSQLIEAVRQLQAAVGSPPL
jgi:hypothetical protein